MVPLGTGNTTSRVIVCCTTSSDNETLPAQQRDGPSDALAIDAGVGFVEAVRAGWRWHIFQFQAKTVEPGTDILDSLGADARESYKSLIIDLGNIFHGEVGPSKIFTQDVALKCRQIGIRIGWHAGQRIG
jgi:hypothetical protein